MAEIKGSTILSGYSAAQAVSQANAKNFTISNATGTDARIRGLILKFKSGLETVKIKLKGSKSGIPLQIIENETDLCAIGTVRTETVGGIVLLPGIQIYKLLAPYPFQNGASMDVYLTTGSTAISADDIYLGLVCEF